MSESIKRGEKNIQVGKELGRGREKVVYTDPDNESRVKGIFHEYKKEGVEKIKGRFYLTKILHILYPDNIPDIHLAASNPHMIIIDKVDDQIAVTKQQLGKLGKDKHLADELQEELKELNERVAYHKREVSKPLGNLGVTVDSAPGNFTLDANDHITFVDTVEPWGVYGNKSPNFDFEKLKLVIENIEDNVQKKHALTYLEHLNKLDEERKIKK